MHSLLCPKHTFAKFWLGQLAQMNEILYNNYYQKAQSNGLPFSGRYWKTIDFWVNKAIVQWLLMVHQKTLFNIQKYWWCYLHQQSSNSTFLNIRLSYLHWIFTADQITLRQTLRSTINTLSLRKQILLLKASKENFQLSGNILDNCSLCLTLNAFSFKQ